MSGTSSTVTNGSSGNSYTAITMKQLKNGSPNNIRTTSSVDSSSKSRGSISKASKSTSSLGYRATFKRINTFMESIHVQLFLMGLLALSLFMSDSWTIGNAPDSQNDALYGVLACVFVIFCIETIVLSIVADDYFLGFFFWMDIVGTISIIFDIGWIVGDTQRSLGQKLSILRTTRAAKIGARYSRYIRLFKLMSFSKYLPCCRDNISSTSEPTMSALRRVSNELSSILSQRVSALVMIFVIIVPFLSYQVVDYSPDTWLSNLYYVANTNSASVDSDISSIVTRLIEFYENRDAKVSYVYVSSPYTSNIVENNYDTRRNHVLRSQNVFPYESVFTLNSNDYKVAINMDLTRSAQFNSALNIVLVILVVIVLFAFSMSFQNAVDRLVVNPLEKMMSVLRASATSMLKSVKSIELDDEYADDNDFDGELETDMLEKLVAKLARIMGNILPGGEEAKIDEKMDKDTASWLQKQYSQSGSIQTANNTSNRSGIQSMKVTKHRQSVTHNKQLELVGKILGSSEVDTWNFDALLYDHEQLIEIVLYVFSARNTYHTFKVTVDTFRAFITELSTSYLDNTYHNFKHGVDVCQTVALLLKISQLDEIFSGIEIFSILIAALAHDVGHPGVNNAYLINTKHSLAIAHNDRSPLENMHCVQLYDIMSNEKTNIFANLTPMQWKESRKIIISTILGTDMSNHNAQIGSLKLFYELNGEDCHQYSQGLKDSIDVLADDSKRIFVLDILLHSADVSNPYKPFNICQKWAMLIVEEFCLQGDREREDAMEISPMCDRNNMKICNMQMGFIEFVVNPLIKTFINTFPSCYEMGFNLQNNYTCWGNKRIEEIRVDDTISDKDKEIDNLKARIKSFQDQMSFVDKLKALPIRSSHSYQYRPGMST